MQRTFENFAEWSVAENGANEEAAARKLEMFVDILQQQTGGPLGYRLRRIILTNFWLYGQQEFEIPHGRLFLAGENASGKSTVLSTAFPLALLSSPTKLSAPVAVTKSFARVAVTESLSSDTRIA